MARRFVRTDEDARDLAQDALMFALSRGFDDWSAPARRAWLHGVMRRHAAFVARTEGRRKRREQVTDEQGAQDHQRAQDQRGAQDERSEVKLGAWTWSPKFLAALPPSLRAVALLASADLCSAEIGWLLQLEPATLRTRLSALRRAVHSESESPTLPAPEPRLALGQQRAPLLERLKRLPGQALATHDPDGHTILLRFVAHKSGARGNT